MSSHALLDVIVLLIALYFLKALYTRKNHAPLPPSPKGFPVIGNILDLPRGGAWRTFTEWGEKFGSDVVSFTNFGKHTIVLNTSAAAFALLDKKSSIYSDRPTLMMAGQLCRYDNGLPLSRYHTPPGRFRGMRRMFKGLFGTKELAEKFVGVEERCNREFLKKVGESPERLFEHIRWLVGSVILEITYGYQVKSEDDPIVEKIETSLEQFVEATTPGAFLVDIIPSLRFVPEWFPGAGWKRKASLWGRTRMEMLRIPFEYVKAQMAAGTVTPSFVSNLLEGREVGDEEEFDIMCAAGSMHGAGSDTTIASINSFLLAMTLHPSVQATARAELDRVVGPDRLPNLADRKDLVYLEAVMKEVTRLNPIGPLGLPHRVTEDDVYEGYLIPKDSVVFANIWQMLHEPSVYHNPHEFNPSRFLGPNPERDPSDFCFGFGRRICPGLHLADLTIYLTCATILSVFEISKVVDPKNGEVITPTGEYTGRLVNHPKPFVCDIKPRSTAAEGLIRALCA
ncbi:hypothetical protein JAAARDRAFT_262159 [Jaapia argillacea MUCL 33604]|uniref:Cytochrome P450 n=1 Tax=Jaapia argillacea MUCL 33604 TaxID=933084 RepID=A0A067Q6P8_9AGAM|nr:hypothetical protein JAAARDRAFT_262159 [Jaapia argillacea MUCL 33604]